MNVCLSTYAVINDHYSVRDFFYIRCLYTHVHANERFLENIFMNALRLKLNVVLIVQS